MKLFCEQKKKNIFGVKQDIGMVLSFTFLAFFKMETHLSELSVYVSLFPLSFWTYSWIWIKYEIRIESSKVFTTRTLFWREVGRWKSAGEPGEGTENLNIGLLNQPRDTALWEIQLHVLYSLLFSDFLFLSADNIHSFWRSEPHL